MTSEEREMVREEVVESFERSAEVYGLSRSAGRVYGVLYFADGSLSIPELVDGTGYAKSTISTVTRRLTRLGLVRRRSSSGGGKRVRFTAEADLWFVLEEVLQQYVHREISASQRTFDRALRRLRSLDDEDTATDEERIEELQDTYAALETLLDASLEYSPSELAEAIEQYDGS
jgi:DNA-binding transcriptional regulator GbsR (MarR family)